LISEAGLRLLSSAGNRLLYYFTIILGSSSIFGLARAGSFVATPNWHNQKASNQPSGGATNMRSRDELRHNEVPELSSVPPV
jgi:hypothetical protein